MGNLIKLNLARNCLKYIIKSYGIKQLFIPYFTCPVVWQSIREVGCAVKFYHIDDKFLPITEFGKKDYILYTNYFGLFEDNCKILAKKYKNLIVDNSQGFYSENYGIATFNSLRKFFRVQNGTYLYIEKILNEQFPEDELSFKYNPLIQEDYESFLKNELFLDKEKEIKMISKNVKIQMNNVDLNFDKNFRHEYFEKYAIIFNKFNKIKFKFNENSFPYCYPLSCSNEQIKNKLISLNLPLLRLWKNFPSDFIESTFLNDTVALPLNDKSFADYILEKF